MKGIKIEDLNAGRRDLGKMKQAVRTQQRLRAKAKLLDMTAESCMGHDLRSVRVDCTMLLPLIDEGDLGLSVGDILERVSRISAARLT